MRYRNIIDPDGWRYDPITDRQKAYIIALQEKLKDTTAIPNTKGEAADMIDSLNFQLDESKKHVINQITLGMTLDELTKKEDNCDPF